MKILFISPWYPQPPDNGAKIRITNLLSALCSQHEVALVAAHQPASLPAVAAASPLSECQKIIPVPWSPQPVQGVYRLLSFIWAKPDWVFFIPDLAMYTAISQAVQDEHFDLVISYELSTVGYFPAHRPLPLILEDVELGGYLANNGPTTFVSQVRRWLFLWKLQRALQAVKESVSAYTVPSATEAAHLHKLLPNAAPVEIVPNCLDATQYANIVATPQPATLIFTGALTFPANYDAVVYFLREIYPLIKQEISAVRLVVTGRHDGIALPLAEQDESVQLLGFVEDVRPHIAGSWTAIVPLLTGGGTRFKILEAMALGTPVVSTSKGAEGLIAQADRHLLIGDTSQAFAAAVIQLCRDQALRERLSMAGKQLVAEEYTWQAVAPRYLAWIEQVIQASKSKEPNRRRV